MPTVPQHVRRPMVWGFGGIIAGYLIYSGWTYVVITRQQLSSIVFQDAQRTLTMHTWGWLSITAGLLMGLVMHRRLWTLGLLGLSLGVYVQTYFAISYWHSQTVAHIGRSGAAAPMAFGLALLLAEIATLVEHLFGPVDWHRPLAWTHARLRALFRRGR